MPLRLLLALLLVAGLAGCGNCAAHANNNGGAARCSVLSLPL